MIQQPIYQDLSETPEFQQQMMLCPVRVVYDTQMFLQQGEQLQQNQYVINPQNPPPWIQNQVQNQVIYVQNVPNNYMQAYQQPIDPNQFQNYGYNVPQMLVPAAQDPRHIQMIPANLVPNINVNQRTVPQNIAMPNQIMVNEVQNQIGHNQTDVMQSNLSNEIKPQDISNQVIHQMPVFQAEQKLPMQQTLPVMSNVQPRLPQFDQNHVRQVHPQIIGPNVRPNYQIISQNVSPNIQPNYQTVVTQTQKVPSNIQQNYQPIVTQKVLPINKANYQVISGNSQPLYKAIQPRPNQVNNQQIKQLPTQNIVYMNSIRRNNINNIVSAQNVIPNFVKLDSSRKRKSESPEEIHNKVVVIPNQNNVVIKQEPMSKPAVEIISNPTPIMKSENKTVVNSLQITPIDTQNVKIKEELAKPVRNISFMEPKQMIRKKMMNNVEAIQGLTTTSVQDKLVRNTVYMQARGRLISEQQETRKDVLPNSSQTENVDSKLSVNDKTEIVDKNIEEKNHTQDNVKEIKTECLDSTVEKDEKSFLLTHVLDGYVIQESNMAFPIRRPLKEKTLRMSTEAIDPIREFKEDKKLETKVDNERLLDISQINLKESKSKEEQDTKDQDNPFKHINPNDVKTWSVEQLSGYLKKFGWDETISLLQDHEIDGESLCLVSKAQLMKIGISEEHATTICDFINPCTNKNVPSHDSLI